MVRQQGGHRLLRPPRAYDRVVERLPLEPAADDVGVGGRARHGLEPAGAGDVVRIAEDEEVTARGGGAGVAGVVQAAARRGVGDRERRQPRPPALDDLDRPVAAAVVRHHQLPVAPVSLTGQRRQLIADVRLSIQHGDDDADQLREAQGANTIIPLTTRSRLILAVHSLLLRTAHTPLRRLWSLVYRLAARTWAASLAHGERDSAAYVRGSLGADDVLPGLSDIDVAVV